MIPLHGINKSMQLVHHSSESYETKKGQMADNVRARFEKTIAQGQVECQKVLEQLDADQPEDRVVRGQALRFIPISKGVEISVEGHAEGIHDHALGQFAGRAKMPMQYVRFLQENDNDLLADNLTRLYTRQGGRYLLRSVRGQTRACLSDRFRRLDCRPLFAAFYETAIRGGGAVPTRGYALETKTAIRVILPTVFEPIPNEPMLYGLEWHNSDFGHGTHSLRSFVHRPWCTNEATADDALRQIHLGRRLEDDTEYSEKTYHLDQATSVSALNDVVKALLLPANVDRTMGAIAAAHEAKVDTKELSAWLKTNLPAGDAKRVAEAFNSPDVENLPPGNTKWRLSNAISFVATQTEDKYKALDLERLAGKAMAA